MTGVLLRWGIPAALGAAVIAAPAYLYGDAKGARAEREAAALVAKAETTKFDSALNGLKANLAEVTTARLVAETKLDQTLLEFQNATFFMEGADAHCVGDGDLERLRDLLGEPAASEAGATGGGRADPVR